MSADGESCENCGRGIQMDKVLKEGRVQTKACLFWEKDQLAWKWKEVRRPGQGRQHEEGQSLGQREGAGLDNCHMARQAARMIHVVQARNLREAEVAAVAAGQSEVFPAPP